MKLKISKKDKSTLTSLFVTLLKSLLKVSGFQAQVVAFVGEHLMEEIGIPLANALLVEVNYRYDVHEGKKYLVKSNEATNVEEYNDAADVILGGHELPLSGA
jgi:hypothetical protein